MPADNTNTDPANPGQKTGRQDRIDFVLSQLEASSGFHFAFPAASAAKPTAEMAQPHRSPQQKKTRTAAEMAKLILDALNAIEGSPKAGFLVTVYGLRPWNAMLTITPEARGIAQASVWRERVRDIAIRLREDFDIAYPDEGSPLGLAG